MHSFKVGFGLGIALTIQASSTSPKADTLLRGAAVGSGGQQFSSATAGDLSQLGYAVADGLVLIPTGSIETGYVNNPDALFTRGKASPFGETSASAVLGYFNPAGATTFAFKGRVTSFDSDIERPERWDAGFAIDNAYKVAANTVVTGGAYVLRDKEALVPSDNVGGYAQVAYRDPGIEVSSRLKSDQINYLGRIGLGDTMAADVIPFITPSAFDVTRTESVTSVLAAPNAFLGFYGEAGAAKLDYLSQPDPAILDRDATEGWVKGGVRLNPDKAWRIEAGWRYNDRETNDHRVSHYDSNFFDGKVVWVPSSNVQVVLDVDRRLVEPGTAFAIVGDQRLYTLSLTYKPAAEWTLQGFARYRLLDEIGDVQRYKEHGEGLSASYQWTAKTNVYGAVAYSHGEETSSSLTYDTVRVSAGTKTQF